MMEVHTLASTIVDRIQDMEDRMRQPMMWQVTDVLLTYERLLNETIEVLREADVTLLAAGYKRTDPVRRKISSLLEKLQI